MRYYGFLSFFGTLAHIGAQTLFVSKATWHTTLFGIDYCVEVFIIEIVVICKKLRVQLRFYGFLSFFGAFAHKLAQTQFDLNETLYIIV